MPSKEAHSVSGKILGEKDAQDLMELSDDELNELYRQQEFAKVSTADQGGSEILPPASITLVTQERITSSELRSVIYTRLGVYIEGTWEGQDEAQHVLIPWDRVSYLSFNFELMNELLEAEQDEGDA